MMHTTFLQRLLTSLAPTSLRLGGRLRLEVTPPAARRFTRPLRQRLHEWLVGGAPLDSTASWSARAARQGQAAPLVDARWQFSSALDDIPAADATATLERVRVARSLHELWHLRSEIFSLVSHHHDQTEAGRRLALLNRHFPSRARRSHFARFRNRDARESVPPQ